MPHSLGMGGGAGFGRHRTLLSKMAHMFIGMANFQARFTAGELAAIASAAIVFPADQNGMVDLYAQATIAWVNQLVTLGLLNQSRIAIILTA